MKNPLPILSEPLGITPIQAWPTEAATREFCYDHVSENHPATEQEALRALSNYEFQSLGIQELNKKQVQSIKQ